MAAGSDDWYRRGDSHGWTKVLAVTIALIVLIWLTLILTIDSVRFVVFIPSAKTGLELFLAFGQLFGAFILTIDPVPSTWASRMRWASAGFYVLGLGAIGCGYLYPLIVDTPDPHITMYGSLYVRTMALILIASGLVLAPHHLSPRKIRLGLMPIFLLVSIGLAMVVQDLPPLIHLDGADTHLRFSDIEHVAMEANAPFPGLTRWYWGASLVPFIAGMVAVWGALRVDSQRPLRSWFLVAIMLLAGSQLYSLFWPSMCSSLFTATSILGFGVAIVLIGGGVMELRRLTGERMKMLVDEQKRSRHLEELAALRDDFTAIVAHELGTPLASISAMTELISTNKLSDEDVSRAVNHIRTQTRGLQLLVRDIRATAEVDRDDFEVNPQRTPMTSLMGDADIYARTLPDSHPITVENDTGVQVWADPERIGQVLRNLLTNAVRHTPPGTLVTLRADRGEGSITIAVSDCGQGIDAADRARIFEKFGRGQGAAQRNADGRGLGLYLSRRIVQAHGSDLTVESEPDRGTTFRFTLEEVPCGEGFLPAQATET